jgi:phage terminase large subunit
LIKLNSKYEPLFLNDTRFFLITGGRGSAKSFGVGTFINLLSFEQGHTILFTRQTMTSAHLSIIPEFQEKIDLMELNNFFAVTKTEIINKKSGSKIIFKGIKTSSGDQTANLKSLQGVTTWILDEAEELTDEITFDKINLSIRQKGKQNRVILILNPATKEHWIYKRFFEDAGVQEGFNGIKDDVTYIHTNYLDNLEHLDKSFINEVERVKKNNPLKYQHTILGGWLNRAEGIIYTNWQLGEFIDTGFNFFGQDYGFSIDPTTLVKCSIDKTNKIIYVKEFLYQSGLTTSQIADINLTYCGKTLIIADSAEPRLISELKSKGCNIKGISKPKITDRIAQLQDYKIIVEHESKNIVKELNNYVWHDKKSETPIDNYNHILDAIGYVLWDATSRPIHISGSSNYSTL